MKKSILVCVFAPLIISCQDQLDRNDLDTSSVINYVPAYDFVEAQTELGDVIDIPYTIENLKKALDLLPSETKALISESEFLPTHYYVRFAPKDVSELDLLTNLSPRVIWSEVPLDREVKTGGIYYHDPSLPRDRPTYQYATISINRWPELDTLKIEHKILLKAFIPDFEESPEAGFTKTASLSPALELLMRKAYEMVGAEYDPVSETKGGSWYPSGYIKAYDNYAGDVPISKVRVRGTKFLTTKETLTNSNGYYRLDSFNGSVSLKVIWESDQWDIRYGLVSQATYDGPSLNGGQWNLTIPSEQTGSLHMATMHRAAHRMFYGNILNLSRPNYSRKFKMSYMESTLNGGSVGGYFNGGNWIMPDVQIAGYDVLGARTTPRVFSSTCHEVGHAMEYSNTNHYSSISNQLKESWARFVQCLVTVQEYTELNSLGYLYTYQNGVMLPDNTFNFQAPMDYWEETPVFIDLYDDYNQRLIYNTTNYPNDEVSGMTPTQIEQMAFVCDTMYDLELSLRALARDNPYNPYNLSPATISNLVDLYYLYPGDF